MSHTVLVIGGCRSPRLGGLTGVMGIKPQADSVAPYSSSHSNKEVHSSAMNTLVHEHYIIIYTRHVGENCCSYNPIPITSITIVLVPIINHKQS